MEIIGLFLTLWVCRRPGGHIGPPHFTEPRLRFHHFFHFKVKPFPRIKPLAPLIFRSFLNEVSALSGCSKHHNKQNIFDPFIDLILQFNIVFSLLGSSLKIRPPVYV
ncbi:hypothetical protein GOODEAATRI_006363 [Goodea atripinnis]|uniref:Secreted protein n=1 Tax=Goodea atripinnis TaxID=208336 RepID=A0ABV0MFJ2_9TELE